MCVLGKNLIGLDGTGPREIRQGYHAAEELSRGSRLKHSLVYCVQANAKERNIDPNQVSNHRLKE